MKEATGKNVCLFLPCVFLTEAEKNGQEEIGRNEKQAREDTLWLSAQQFVAKATN